MSESAMNELREALELLRTDIAVAIPWGVMHRFANANPLHFEHYAQIERLWHDVWRQANPGSTVPRVDMYFCPTKLTMVRDNTLADSPAIELSDWASARTTA